MSTQPRDRILLFHFSDLHFGSRFEGSLIASSGLRSGLNGHSLEISQNLPVAIKGALQRDFKTDGNDTVEYLVSGDLTPAPGSQHDFQLVYTYLYSELQWLHDRHGQPVAMGLKLPRHKVHQVPGNHDHWQGKSQWPQPAYNGGAFPDLMDPTLVDAKDPSARRTIYSPNKQVAFELFRVDSNEGLGTGRSLRAAGRLSPEQLDGQKNAAGQLIKQGLLQQMQDAVSEANKDKVPRIAGVACHHSLGTRMTNLGRAMPLEPNSIAALLKLVRRFTQNFAIRTVLTGHTHYPIPRALPNNNDPLRVWELRAASTLQMNPQPADQGFWVHEIALDDASRPFWNAWLYTWNGTSFVKGVKHHPIR